MAWKFEPDIPLTAQIARRLRRDILSGSYSLGGDFPTVRQLAAEAAVNPNTIQRAIVLLEDEGLLVTLGTSGRTVTNDAAVIDAARERTVRELAIKTINEARLLGFSEQELIEVIRRNWNDEQ